MSQPENCTHDCESCTAACDQREKSPGDFLEQLNEYSSVKKVYAVVSGKGGVGKSLVCGLTACALNRRGLKTAILDADITGPSIPKLFGIHKKALGSDMGILPARSAGGIDIMSVNLLLENEGDPVVWRGPIIAGTVRQFWTDVVWHDIDVMLVDMPPGTGDVPLTVFQSLPVDGIIMVTSPQELVSMIVSKAVRMANLMKIPIVGIAENMSYFKCPCCGQETRLFGESHVDTVAKEFGLPVLTRLPISPEAAAACDAGEIENFRTDWLDNVVNALLAQQKK